MFKGVVSIGGPLPDSMVSRPQQRSRTPVLLCHGQDSTALDEDAVASVRERFVDVRETVWPAGANRRRGDDSMPRNRDEMLPIMRFWAETLAALGPDGQGRSVF